MHRALLIFSIGYDWWSDNAAAQKLGLFSFNPFQAHCLPAQEKVLNVRFAVWVGVREHPVQLAGVFKERSMLCEEYMVLVGD